MAAIYRIAYRTRTLGARRVYCSSDTRGYSACGDLPQGPISPLNAPYRRFFQGRVYARRCPYRASLPLSGEAPDRLCAHRSIELIWGLWVVVCAMQRVCARGFRTVFLVHYYSFALGARGAPRGAGSLGRECRAPVHSLRRHRQPVRKAPSCRRAMRRRTRARSTIGAF